MEKRTTQRIIGVLIAIAFVVVLMPWVLTKNDFTQTAAVKAPPFPDQQAPQGVNPSNDNTVSSPVISQDMTDRIEGTPVSANQQSDEAVPFAPTPKDNKTQANSLAKPASTESLGEYASSMVIPLPDQDSASTVTPTSQTSVETAAVTSSPKVEDNQSSFSIDEKSVVSRQPASQEDKQSNYSVTSSDNTQSVAPVINQDNLPATSSTSSVAPKANVVGTTDTHSARHQSNAQTKQTAWVIQMGSFKSKSNAQRLANRLRNAGYKTFLKEVKMAHGTKQTRVYIGPESQHTNVAKLSTKIQRELNLQGLVTAYKPMAL